MKPTELQSILDRLGVSRGKFGEMLGASRRSGENWTDPNGSDVPGPVATMAHLLAARPELIALVEDISGVTRERAKKYGKMRQKLKL